MGSKERDEARSAVRDHLLCSITHEVPHDPVLAADGQVYSRTALCKWFTQGRRTSPLTNAVIDVEDVREVIALTNICAEVRAAKLDLPSWSPTKDSRIFNP